MRVIGKNDAGHRHQNEVSWAYNNHVLSTKKSLKLIGERKRQFYQKEIWRVLKAWILKMEIKL